jgi:hypothetical protein
VDDDAPTEIHAAAHGADGMVGPHGSMADHGEAHGHDDHAHGGETLGPVDRGLWGAAALGILLGIVVAVALAIGASFQLTFGG